MVNVLEALDGCVFVCLLTALMIPSIGMNSVYIANVLNGILSLLYLIGYAILKIRRIPKNMEDLMAIPADFGVPEEERMERTVRTMDEVVCLSEAVQRFCLERGIDQRRAYFAGLSMEEMAGNVVAHGFYKDKKNHSVDIRVTHKDGSVILRIKDDCAPFDPAERWKIFHPEDVTRNIGIRIAHGIADDISYQNILGLNVLTVRI